MSHLFKGMLDQLQPSVQQEQVSGLMLAIVTNNEDPEQRGRVKVTIQPHENNLETDWIRVASMMAGNDMGTLFIPEVNDEVIIGFVMGRQAVPIVIGSLWNGKAKPPEGTGKNDLRKIKTRSGHVIEFNDKAGDECITVQTKKGHSLILSDKGGSEEISLTTQDKNYALRLSEKDKKVHLKSGSGASIEMTMQGDITIKGNKNLTLDASKVEINAKSSMKLSAQANLEIKSSGMLTLKGSMVKIN